MMSDLYIPQAQLTRLAHLVTPGKVVVVYGPGRVGKTTLIKRYIREHDPDALLVTGEDIVVREYLESRSLAKLTSFVGRRRTLIIDEAQHLQQIGLILKLLADHVEGLRIIATGSSSFGLAHQADEPLTGRTYTLPLLPPAQLELQETESPHQTRAHLEQRLIYGSYPEVVHMDSNEDRQIYIKELIASYLFRDILQLEGIRHADKLLRLLQRVAFQIGREASTSELGTQLGMSANTVDRYLDLLEKYHILYSRRGFSRNLRKEITKSQRYYFCDNGIRNGLINNFNPLALRNDAEDLWKNYILVERLKNNLYKGRLAESYFWRTYDRQEIDLVEEWGGRLLATEMKWTGRSHRAPGAWRKAYPDSPFHVVHPENYLGFITGSPATP